MYSSFTKMEFRRTYFRWQFVLAFIGFMAMFIYMSIVHKSEIPTVETFPQKYILESSNAFHTYTRALGGTSSYMMFVLPLFIVLLCGDSLFQDYKTGFMQFALPRVNYDKYIRSKIIAVSVVSFVTFLMFQIVAFSYSLASSPYHLPTEVALETGAFPPASSSLYFGNAYVYIVIVMLIISLMAATFAVIGIICSNLFNNVFLVIGIPWLGYVLLSQIMLFLMPYVSRLLEYLNPMVMAGPFLFYSSHSLWGGLAYWVVVFALLVTLAVWLSSRKFELRSS